MPYDGHVILLSSYLIVIHGIDKSGGCINSHHGKKTWIVYKDFLHSLHLQYVVTHAKYSIMSVILVNNSSSHLHIL